MAMESINLVREKLARLESRLQTLIEGSAARLFSFSASVSDLAPNLIAAMQAGIKTRADGTLIAPNQFTLIVHPGQKETLQNDHNLLESLCQALHETGREAGLLFMNPPVIRVRTDEAVAPLQIRVTANINQAELTQTTDVEIEAPGNGLTPPSNAFLIVDGTQVFPLIQSVINIGRRPDNDLVINDPRVSRQHAQLRAVKGHYVIFDLESTGGTFINDQPIIQSMLYPGDVISLSGVPLVFGQESAIPGETQKFDPLDES